MFDIKTSFQSATPVFLVDDVAATIEWYKTTLGFAADVFPESAPHAFGILSKDDVAIFLQQLAGYEKPDLYRQRDGGVWSAYLRVRGVHALFDSLQSRSDVTVVKPLRRQPYGETEFEIRDPNGYVLVFAERL